MLIELFYKEVILDEEIKQIKKRLLDFLRKEGYVRKGDSGTITIHLNEGGITTVTKNIDLFKSMTGGKNAT